MFQAWGLKSWCGLQKKLTDKLHDEPTLLYSSWVSCPSHLRLARRRSQATLNGGW